MWWNTIYYRNEIQISVVSDVLIKKYSLYKNMYLYKNVKENQVNWLA